MKSTGWSLDILNRELFAKRYIKGKAVPNYNLVTYPDGGLISSAADLSTYLMAMIEGFSGEGELLSAASFKEMMSNQYEQSPLKSSIIKTEKRSGISGIFLLKKAKVILAIMVATQVS